MKKIFAAMMILGLGMMVGCGETPTGGHTTTGTTAATPHDTVTHTTAHST